jgi:hypothetical protein
MVKRVPGVSQICRRRPVGHRANSRFEGKYSRISARKRALAIETAADINALRANSRGIATGILALLIGNYFRRTGNYLRRDGNCPASPNPPDFGARPDPGATPSASRRPRRLADNPTSSSTTATLAARRSRLPNTANWAILPSPCPASGTIVCLEAPLAGLVPAIHAVLCLADLGLQDGDARIKSGQGVF